MVDEQRARPPQVTISDPNHPGELVDVLGSGDERGPWTPSPRFLKLSLVLVLVLALVGVPAAVLKRRSDDRAASRRALAAVDLQVPDSSGASIVGAALPQLRVQNLGPDEVHVVGSRVDREGYHHQRADLRLTSQKTGALVIGLEPTCPATPPRSGPTGVLLDVVTSHGDRTTIRVRTAYTDWSFSYVFAVQERCRLFPLEESLDATVEDVVVRARAVTATVSISNRAKAERTLVGLTAPIGFSVTTPSVLPLPVTRDHLSLTFTVTSCAAGRPRPLPSLGTGQVLDEEPDFDRQVRYDVSGDGRTATGIPLVTSEGLSSSLNELYVSECP